MDPRKGHRVRRGEGLPIQQSKASPYSIDQNVWGRAVETGFLEDIWNAPIEDVYAYTANPATPREPDEVMITFEAGNPIAIDNEKVSMLQAIQILNERAGAHGVGRLDMVEDRLVGIKSREVYEAPGAITLITAHMELENVTVERELARYKRGIDQRWGELVYDGQWYSPLKRALDTFIDEAQQPVSGEIRMILARREGHVTGAAATPAFTTSISPPTTRATGSTNRHAASSGSMGCRARWRRADAGLS